MQYATPEISPVGIKTGALKMQDMKMQDMKLTDHFTGICKAWNCRTWKCMTCKGNAENYSSEAVNVWVDVILINYNLAYAFST